MKHLTITMVSAAEQYKPVSLLSSVSSASMTRLRSSSSFSSFDGSRSRTHTNELQRGRTHSHTTDEKRGHSRHNTDVSMESISNSNVDQIVSKSTEVTCQSTLHLNLMQHQVIPQYINPVHSAMPLHLHYITGHILCDSQSPPSYCVHTYPFISLTIFLVFPPWLSFYTFHSLIRSVS